MAWQLVYTNPTGEGGERYWQDDTTGATARFDAENPVPPPEVNLGSSGMVSLAPSFLTGSEGQSVRDFDISVNGQVADGDTLEANSKRVGDSGTILNKQTGQREQAYSIDIGGKRAWLPKSIALQVDPNAQPYTVYADGGYAGLGGLFDQYGTQALMAAVLGAGAAGLGGGAGSGIVGDLGTAAFPLDAGTIAGMNGTGAVSVGAGSIGGGLQGYPLGGGGMEASPWDEFYSYFNGEGSVLPQAGDIGSNSFPIFESGPQVGANTTGATGLGQLFSSLPESVQGIVRNLGTSGLKSLFGGSGTGNFGSILGGGNGGQSGGYQFPWGDVLGALGEAWGANKQAETLKDLMNQAINSDQWRTQAPRYYEPLYKASTEGIGNTAYGESITNKTLASLAARGYNNSGNQAPDVARALNSGTVDYMKAMTPLAMGRGESTAATSLAPGVAAGSQAVGGALGYGLQSIFNGSQPNSLQQLMGTPKNNTLAQSIGNSQVYL